MFANRSHAMLGHVCDQIDWNGPNELLDYWVEEQITVEQNGYIITETVQRTFKKSVEPEEKPWQESFFRVVPFPCLKNGCIPSQCMVWRKQKQKNNSNNNNKTISLKIRWHLATFHPTLTVNKSPAPSQSLEVMIGVSTWVRDKKRLVTYLIVCNSKA